MSTLPVVQTLVGIEALLPEAMSIEVEPHLEAMLGSMPWKEIDPTVPVEVLGQYQIIAVPEAIRPIGAVHLTIVHIKAPRQGLLPTEVRAAPLLDRPVEPTEVLAQHDHQVEHIEVILAVLLQGHPVAT